MFTYITKAATWIKDQVVSAFNYVRSFFTKEETDFIYVTDTPVCGMRGYDQAIAEINEATAIFGRVLSKQELQVVTGLRILGIDLNIVSELSAPLNLTKFELAIVQLLEHGASVNPVTDYWRNDTGLGFLHCLFRAKCGVSSFKLYFEPSQWHKVHAFEQNKELVQRFRSEFILQIAGWNNREHVHSFHGLTVDYRRIGMYYNAQQKRHDGTYSYAYFQDDFETVIQKIIVSNIVSPELAEELKKCL